MIQWSRSLSRDECHQREWYRTIERPVGQPKTNAVVEDERLAMQGEPQTFKVKMEEHAGSSHSLGDQGLPYHMSYQTRVLDR